MLHECPVIPCLLHLIKRQTFFYSKALHLGSDKLLHHRTAAKLLSYIPAQASDICSLGTAHIECHPRKFYRLYGDTMYRDQSRLSLYNLSGSRQLIELLTIYLDG